MGIMNGLTFGGINSLDYGIYISGEAVFNAPARDVEMLQIPGRNGDLVLDHGRFENVEVSYPAGTFGDDQTDFREKLSDFRNAILSQVGYQRLTDTYHPDEYRMGVYASGLEVAPVHYNTAGEFVLTFNCKPQRWLTSGEDSVAIADGGTLDNPTLFESEPLIKYDGYGTIEFNGYTIETDNVYLGDVVLAENETVASYSSFTVDVSSLNVGDAITINASASGLTIVFTVNQPRGLPTVSSSSITDTNALCSTAYSGRTKLGETTSRFTYTTNYEPFDIVVGTSSSVTNTANMTVNIAATTNYSAYSFTVQSSQTVSYDASTQKLTVSQTITFGGSPPAAVNINSSGSGKMTYDSIIGHSTIPIDTETKYIDCEIGEVYTIRNGELVPMNDLVALGSDLPRLISGTNTFNYDNTITNFEITPRWWKV